jgi:hypothetical protein
MRWLLESKPPGSIPQPRCVCEDLEADWDEKLNHDLRYYYERN